MKNPENFWNRRKAGSLRANLRGFSGVREAQVFRKINLPEVVKNAPDGKS